VIELNKKNVIKIVNKKKKNFLKKKRRRNKNKF
jgi:hypothetical protein